MRPLSDGPMKMSATSQSGKVLDNEILFNSCRNFRAIESKCKASMNLSSENLVLLIYFLQNALNYFRLTYESYIQTVLVGLIIV